MIAQLGYATIALCIVLLLLVPVSRQHMPPGWYLTILAALAAGIAMAVCA